MLKNHFWYIPNALDVNEIEHIRLEGDSLIKLYSSQAYHHGDAHRSSKITWIDDSLTNECITNIIEDSNVQAGWLFSLIRPEKTQYTVYKKGDEYDWHVDGFQDRYAAKQLVSEPLTPMPLDKTTNPLLAGLVRKLSISVNLSSPEDYEGGNLQLRYNNQTWEIDSPPIGSAIVFPSFIEHRITPVTKGIRKSLVLWNLGYPYR
jgi:PKHD-type hydroxylase